MPMRGGPGGPRRGPMEKGKLKNSKATIKRLLGYLKEYRLRIGLVLICMLTNTVTSLFGSYLLAPVINKLTFFVTGEEAEMSAMERFADGIISGFTGPINALMRNEVVTYIIATISIFAFIYGVCIITTYLQSRLMLSI